MYKRQSGDQYGPAGRAGDAVRVTGGGVFGGAQDGFLGEEAGERRDRGEREQRDGGRPVGVRDAPGQAAHPGHGGQRVGARGVDDHACAEEEEGLERAVREEVEDGGAAVADGQGAEHVAELADRRIGQDALDVVLGQRGQARADHGDRGHHGEHDQRGGGGGEDGEETGHEIDTGRHHRRGVDQRRDGRRTGHRVRQPGVQRELRRLARDTGQQQQRDQRRVVQAAAGDGAEDAGDPEGPGVCGQREDAEEERDVAELGDEEGLEGGGAGGLGLPVVADEEVGADAHDFPADQQQHQVAGVDDQQHRGSEERDQRGVGGVARIVAQIAGGVDLHTGRHDPDQDRHQHGEAVEVQGQVDGDRAGRGEPGGDVGGRAGALSDGDGHGERGRGQRRQHCQRPDEAGRTASQEEAGDGPEEGQEGNENSGGRERHAAASAVVSGCGSPSAAPVFSARSRSRSMSELPRLR